MGNSLSIFKQSSYFVDRGDPIDNDWLIGDFPLNDTIGEIDCSGVIPVGTKFIDVSIAVNCNNVGAILALFKNGYTNLNNIILTEIQVSGVSMWNDGIIACDANRKIGYYKSTATWNYIGVLVRGWILE